MSSVAHSEEERVHSRKRIDGLNGECAYEEESSISDDEKEEMRKEFFEAKEADKVPVQVPGSFSEDNGCYFANFDGEYHHQDLVGGDHNFEKGNNDFTNDVSANNYYASLRSVIDARTHYPAPVPRLLNLPFRLSQNISATSNIRYNHKNSNPSLELKDYTNSDAAASPINPVNNVEAFNKDSKRKTKIGSLPPQLRASTYFHRDFKLPEVNTINSSAIEALDCMLENASKASSSVTNENLDANNVEDRHEGSHGVAHSRKDDIDFLMKKQEEEPRKYWGRFSLFKKKSRFDEMKPNTDIDSISNYDSIRQGLIDTGLTEGHSSGNHHSRSKLIHENGPDTDNSNLPSEHIEGAPNTLLAELNKRKTYQKHRTRNVLTGYPNGIRSTLLELDAIAQIEKKRRDEQRVQLAWEESDNNPVLIDQVDESDDNVPLGLIFSKRSAHKRQSGRGTMDENYLPGLIQSSYLEDNEPLSMRRFRLKGKHLDLSRFQTLKHDERIQPLKDLETSASEDENETLTQRLKKLKERERERI